MPPHSIQSALPSLHTLLDWFMLRYRNRLPSNFSEGVMTVPTLISIPAHALCASRVCVKCAQTQISRVKNSIFHTNLHSAGIPMPKESRTEFQIQFCDKKLLCDACGTNSRVKNMLSGIFFTLIFLPLTMPQHPLIRAYLCQLYTDSTFSDIHVC